MSQRRAKLFHGFCCIALLREETSSSELHSAVEFDGLDQALAWLYRNRRNLRSFDPAVIQVLRSSGFDEITHAANAVCMLDNLLLELAGKAEHLRVYSPVFQASSRMMMQCELLWSTLKRNASTALAICRVASSDAVA